MSGVETSLYILRGAGAVLGAVFFYVTVRAYVRHRARSMGVLALATALLTLGAVTEGAVLQFAGEDALDLAHIIESVVFLAAFGVLLFSVLRPPRGRSRTPPRGAEQEKGPSP